MRGTAKSIHYMPKWLSRSFKAMNFRQNFCVSDDLGLDNAFR